MIHPTAIVHSGARIGEGTRLGPYCVIDGDVIIGEQCEVGPHVYITGHTRIGANNRIHAGCVIGGDGFGGALDNGRWLKMPHVGRVVIGDDVEVGANTTIDRGAMADTVIEDGVKLDNQIQIGHNVRIGAHTSIAGCVGIAGSATIGARCVIGGAAMIGGHLRIVDDVHISGGTAVASSIDQPGRYTGLYPVSEHRTWVRTAIALRRMGTSRSDRSRSASASPEQDDT